MSRYSRRPKAWIEDETYEGDAPMIPALTVDDHQAVDTGLLWENGDTIWREPNPMGFGRDEEWA